MLIIGFHKGLGPGLLESVYEEILFHELYSEGLFIERQKLITVVWNGVKIDQVLGQT